MVATIGQMASAEYYLESQRSYRHPNEYYTAGEEPDGTWFNPAGLFGLADGAKVDSADFQRLYSGFAPDGSGKLVQRAGNPDRSPGVDLTFSVDKSVSALWAIAEPGMRERIEAMAVASARAALEDTVLRYCSYTRVSAKGVTRPVEADLMGATFVHGTNRENDPQLHVHCAIFNVARTQEDGKWRAHHQYPVYSWKKAAGAVFRACMAWELQQGLGVRMAQYGPNAGFTRIEGMPDDLLGHWSKRRKAIVARAGELGIPSLGNAARMAGVNKLTRAGKSHDNDPEVRHARWRDEAEGFVEREALIASVTGHDVKVSREAIRELTDRLDDLPAHLAREEAVFRRPDMVEAAANAAAGLMGRDAVGTAIERLHRNPEIERLKPKKPTAESRSGMAHTEVYAMTIASAQGLTVDRAFLLVDDRPARETIYPAATRHREGIDVYVNRCPLVFDLSERRPEDEAERPVTDIDVRACLAERWSRSQPKEAALNYVSEGAWRDAREEARHRRDRGEGQGRAARRRPEGAGRTEAAEARAAANDNALARIAGEIRHVALGWHHGAAVDAFAAERTHVLAAWDGLRARTRADGDSVALSPAFRETLDRHGALLKQVEAFGARPQAFGRLLAERAGIHGNGPRRLRGAACASRQSPARRRHAGGAPDAPGDGTAGARDKRNGGTGSNRHALSGSGADAGRLLRLRPAARRRGPCPGARHGGSGGAGRGAARARPPSPPSPTGGRSTTPCNATGTTWSPAPKNPACRCR